MRAVFDNPRVASLVGTNPNVVSTLSWCIGSAIAALSGIVLAPVLQLEPNVFMELTVAAVAAALVARLSSIPFTMLAALVLGLASGVISALSPDSGLLAVGLRPALPFVVMAVVLVVRRRPLDVAALTVRVRPDPRWIHRPVVPILGMLVVVAVVVVSPSVVGSNYWIGKLTLGLIFAIAFMGYTVSLGDAGVLPLSQGAMLGIGGFVTAKYFNDHGFPFLVALLLGALVATVCGAIIGTVGSRLGTLEFGLLTLSFGIFCDKFLFNWHALLPISGAPFNGVAPFGYDLLSPKHLFYFVGGVTALVMAFVVLLRRSRLAFAWRATRMQPVVAASTGVNVRLIRVLALSASSFLAGLAGGLLGVYQLNLGAGDVSTVAGLVWLAVVVSFGVRSIPAAVVAGFAFALLPAVFSKTLAIRYGELPTILFGLGALSLASSPTGSVTQFRDSAVSMATAIRGATRRRTTVDAT